MIPLDAILLSLLVIIAAAICAAKSLMASIIIYSAYSVVKTIVWILLAAPDLAITEAAVSTGISSILYFIVLKRVLVVRKEHTSLHDTLYAPAAKKPDLYRRCYNVMCVCVTAGIGGVMMYTVSALPPFGDPSNPTNNEVPRKFLEDSIQDSGALNAVASMLFEYRAFDTLAEAAVLITAICAVLILLRNDGPLNSFHAFAREAAEVKQDIILKNMSFLLVGMVLVFGVYIILNGHLTPGGGFSGGAIVGAALVLYVSVFGTSHACRFLNYIVCCRILSASLLFYIVIKGFSFFTGANNIPFKLLPTGTPGSLFSGGLILPLNSAVGLIVACSMYMVFILFGREGVLK